MYLVY